MLMVFQSFFVSSRCFCHGFSKTVPTAPRLGKVLKTMYLQRFSEVRRGLSVEKDLTGLLNTSIVRSLIIHNIEVTETEPLTKRDLLSNKKDSFPTQLLQV